MGIKIIEIHDKKEDIPIVPNIIFNRYDLQGKPYHELLISEDESELRMQISIQGSMAHIGSYMMPMSEEGFKAAIKYVFEQFGDVKSVKYENALHAEGIYNNSPQRLINLPSSIDELHTRLSSKSRYNLKREKRLIEENIGSYTIDFYELKEIPQEAVLKFFEFKNATHGRDYHMKPEDYLERYNVSSAYVMRTEQEILAVLLSCEQCENVYFDNFSYDVKYSQYSLGSVMYDIYLEKLIEKGIRTVYLGSDKYEYKKRYGSVRIEAYSGEVFRSVTYMELKKTYLKMRKALSTLIKRTYEKREDRVD